jgi:hypothetical protein
MQTQNMNLRGVWQVAEVTKRAPAGHKHPAQPGLYIFTGTHYSITVVQGDKPRSYTGLAADASADELREMLRFSAQAGTYEADGDKVILRPSVALRSKAMVPGSESIYSYSLSGDTLALSPRSNNTGIPIDNQELVLHRIGRI